MKLFITSLLAFVLVGCGQQPKTEHHNETPATKVTCSPPVIHEVKKVERGLWKEFGIVGSVYRNDIEPGTIDGIEGGLMIFKTLHGPVWFADFEPNDNADPLDTRKVYLVHISGNLASGCGYAMRDFTTAPPQYVMEEKILSWKEAKNFLEPKVSPNPKDWAKIETFLRRREWKTKCIAEK